MVRMTEGEENRNKKAGVLSGLYRTGRKQPAFSMPFAPENRQILFDFRKGERYNEIVK